MSEHDGATAVDEAAGDTATDRGGVEAEAGTARRRLRTGRKGGGGLRGMMSGLLASPEPRSRTDAEREAALEIEQAAGPAMDRLVLSVPGAETPQEALARIEEGLPARDVPSEPAPAEHVSGAEEAQTLALYQVRRHLQSYRYPAAHEQELNRRLGMRSRAPVSAGGLRPLR